MSRPDPFRWISIVPVNLWLWLWVLVPTLMVLVVSFATRDPAELIAWEFTLDNYARLADPLYLQVFLHSLWLAALTAALCLLLGFPFAWWLARLRPGPRALALFLVVIPFWTNSLIRTYAIKLILSKEGLINTLLRSIGIIDAPLDLLYSPFAVVFGLVYILFPFMVLPLYSNLEKLDHSLLEAARDLGAGRWQVLRQIVIPLTMPGIVAGTLIVFLPATCMFYISDLLGGAKNLLLGNVVRNQFLSSMDWPFGSAISITLILLMGLMLLAYFQASKRINRAGGIHDTTL
ncbi:MAG TPA: spermidine/putrescine ABC transporter permease PotB [Dongiaceae bacterium]|nr:spermidine/putrescine ABC transporter permease PotB [Dongiaceae bacterium]